MYTGNKYYPVYEGHDDVIKIVQLICIRLSGLFETEGRWPFLLLSLIFFCIYSTLELPTALNVYLLQKNTLY
jgi:hypothetical protein